MPKRILIIDDNSSLLASLRILLKREFDQIDIAIHPDHVFSAIAENQYHVILLDMNFKTGQTSGNEGLFWLGKIKKSDPDAVVILMTAFGEVDLAIEAMKRGAFDFVQKPWETEKLTATLRAGVIYRKSRVELTKLKQKNQSRNIDLNLAEDSFIGQSAEITKLRTTIAKVSKTDASILICGENGTGKELVAREIHRLSNRKNGPFVEVDIGALQESLFESELFGHVKGAYTGAEKDRVGRFEYADGGSLFLDEIGNLSLNQQVKLLRVIQEKVIYRVGSNEARPIDIRLICATNLQLDKAVTESIFREDLYYRINTIEIEVPPLRHRKTDILLLCEYYLQKFASKYQNTKLKIDKQALDQLCEYSWPGNVRELRHAIERAVILSDHPVLMINSFQLKDNQSLKYAMDSYNLEQVEKAVITSALERYPGNMSKVAQVLSISRTTLYAKIRKYGL
ncbi:MAG: sigma-54-dependent Fis family transcriptional regulator [Bacteroidetes bacterium]|jgi:DNA-binding NtrC family response regulator|nr:sigma-54-dependent Fis family transcriptional regulator [Bacteroidota bacterium]MBT3747599.1 sigma-54-dependent Fis family transcriptional regulator [Bacteroidota bacterium]MBT4409223.1 sigma-54-dependent Fis family transcriptional regulator [Bacteroidota bacterium]MBT5427591.1 sigma-54-dependent Fis family transcriptional regulator [Bacteroidota bacterium]MBT7094242.1 sigma-54-dependent Fis family transcriptional regulator [Bacteroidota bacterium]